MQEHGEGQRSIALGKSERGAFALKDRSAEPIEPIMHRLQLISMAHTVCYLVFSYKAMYANLSS